MMDQPPVRVTHEQNESIAVIEIGDGTRRNSLGRADWRALNSLVDRISANPAISVIVIASHGDTFSAGSDLNDWNGASREDIEQGFEEMEACFQTIERSPLPVIAAVEGVAAGAGCQLALACDLVVMSTSARIGMPIARLGILASTAFAIRLSRRTGTAVAADLYLTGRLLTADESRDVGLVTRVVPAGVARPEAIALARSMASTPSAALSAAKAVLGRLNSTRVPDPNETSVPVAGPTVSYADFGPAVHAFFSPRASS
jgi:enoyl-CoA hydratase/carnithine racemase